MVLRNPEVTLQLREHSATPTAQVPSSLPGFLSGHWQLMRWQLVPCCQSPGICSIRPDTCGRSCHPTRPFLLRFVPITEIETETDPEEAGPGCLATVPSVSMSIFKHCLTSNTIQNVIAYLLSSAVSNTPTEQDELVGITIYQEPAACGAASPNRAGRIKAQHTRRQPLWLTLLMEVLLPPNRETQTPAKKSYISLPMSTKPLRVESTTPT